MALDRISLSDFRNHAATALDGTARFNLLVGENGAGKTNLLEAVSLLENEPALREVFGDEFVGTYAGVKRGEFETFMQVISPWEREYLLLNV